MRRNGGRFAFLICLAALPCSALLCSALLCSACDPLSRGPTSLANSGLVCLRQVPQSPKVCWHLPVARQPHRLTAWPPLSKRARRRTLATSGSRPLEIPACIVTYLVQDSIRLSLLLVSALPAHLGLSLLSLSDRKQAIGLHA